MTVQRPTIWILDGSIAITGAFTSAREMARALRGQANVELILPKSSRIATDELDDSAVVHRLPTRNLRRSPLAIALYLPYLASATWKLRCTATCCSTTSSYPNQPWAAKLHCRR